MRAWRCSRPGFLRRVEIAVGDVRVLLAHAVHQFEHAKGVNVGLLAQLFEVPVGVDVEVAPLNHAQVES